MEKAREQIRKEVAAGKAEKAPAKPVEVAPPATAPIPTRSRRWSRPGRRRLSPPTSPTRSDAELGKGFTAEDGLHTIAMDAPMLHKPAAEAAPIPVAEGPVRRRTSRRPRHARDQPAQDPGRRREARRDHRRAADDRPGPGAARAGRHPEDGGPQVEDDRRRRPAASAPGVSRAKSAFSSRRPPATSRRRRRPLVAARHGVLGQHEEDDRAAEAGPEQHGTHGAVQVVVGADGRSRPSIPPAARADNHRRPRRLRHPQGRR